MLTDDDPWYVLVADDDDDVLEVTSLALDGMVVDGRRVELLFASTEAQTRALFDRPIAVAILDVIMDTERSGFDLAAWIRHDLRSRSTRIVLRTGQPGQSDGQRAFLLEDINEFWLKTELNVGRMRATLSGLIRSFRDVCEVEHAQRAALVAAWRGASNKMRLLAEPAFVEGLELRTIILARSVPETRDSDETERLLPLLTTDPSQSFETTLLGRSAMQRALHTPGRWVSEGPWAGLARSIDNGFLLLACQPPPRSGVRATLAWMLETLEAELATS